MAGADVDTVPGDDFFAYANGTWLENIHIPADKPGVSFRLQMTDRIEARLHHIMEAIGSKVGNQPTDLEGKVFAFYKSFMDNKRIDRLGAEPLDPLLSEVRAAKSRDALAALMGRASSDLESSLFNVYVDVDLKDPNRYAVYITQNGIGLPDRDYYLKPDFSEHKAKYGVYVAQLLRLLNWPDPDRSARDIVAFEAKVADASWTKAQQRDPVATYNAMTIAELKTLTPSFAWKAFLAQAHLEMISRVIVSEKSAFPTLVSVFEQTPIETLQAWHGIPHCRQRSTLSLQAFRRRPF